jgi:hypothetical protein
VFINSGINAGVIYIKFIIKLTPMRLRDWGLNNETKTGFSPIKDPEPDSIGLKRSGLLKKVKKKNNVYTSRTFKLFAASINYKD